MEEEEELVEKFSALGTCSGELKVVDILNTKAMAYSNLLRKSIEDHVVWKYENLNV